MNGQNLPWEASSCGVWGQSKFGARVKICDVLHSPANGIDGLKHATLIAAAPDLLHVLEIIRDADEDCKKDGLPRWMPECVRIKIDAAITKAKGQKDAA